MMRRMLRIGKWVLVVVGAAVIAVVLAALSAALIALLVISSGIPARRAERRVKQAIADVAKTGAPVKLTQLAKPPIPDAENAALVYQRAFQALRPSEGDKQFVRDIRTGKSTLDDPTTAARARKLLQANAAALRLIHRAADVPQCDFRPDWNNGFNLTFPQFPKLRTCSNLLSLETLVLAHDGRLDEALAGCAANLRLSSNAALEPCLFGVLAQYAVIKITSDSLAATLKDSQPSPGACRSLAVQIAGMDRYEPYVDALKGERAWGITMFEQVRTSPNLLQTIAELSGETSAGRAQPRRAKFSSFSRWLFAADELTYLELMEQVIGQARLPYRKLARMHPSLEERLASLPRVPPRILTAILMPVYGRACIARDRAIALLDVDRIALLLKTYRAQHGRYPESLRDLAGPTGGALPLDTFSGRPYVYRRQGDGFLIYSWGPNLKDDGGVAPPPEDWQAGDIVIECRR